MNVLKQFSPKNITRDQSKDTALAFVLIFLVVGLFSTNFLYIKIGLVLLIIAMIFPLLFKYLASLWLGLAHLLGTVVSKILLSIIFFMVVSPVGLIRRLLGFDTLKLKQFKKGTGSVMQSREYKFAKEDLERPY